MVKEIAKKIRTEGLGIVQWYSKLPLWKKVVVAIVAYVVIRKLVKLSKKINKETWSF